MYAAFSRRETLVTLLEVRAGSPPSALTMLQRFHTIHGLAHLTDMWAAWEVWFAELEESHTSLPALAHFRSPQPERSWVTAAGAVLDAAALTESVLAMQALVRRIPVSRSLIRAAVTLARMTRPPDPEAPSPPQVDTSSRLNCPATSELHDAVARERHRGPLPPRH